MKFIIIAGLSGAGKSQALKVLEDQGFHSVGNLPPLLIKDFIRLSLNNRGQSGDVALVVNTRGTGTIEELEATLLELEQMEIHHQILFLDASDEVLIKRFKELRRPHPFNMHGSIVEGIEFERKALKSIRDKADYVVDTSNLTVGMLKDRILDIFLNTKETERLSINVMSFGFKKGIPRDADLVFDVRFLPNPFYIEELKELTGNDKPVSDYVLSFGDTRIFLEKLEDMLNFLIPRYTKEGKAQLIIGIGCTGGQHRSVTIANCLCEYLLGQDLKVKLTHREQK